MAEPPTSIDQTPEWQALVRHHEAVKDTHLRELFADRPGAGRDADLRGRRPLSRLVKAPGDRRDGRAAGGHGRAGRAAPADRRHVRRRADQPHREPGRAARRPARPRGQLDPGRRPQRRARRPRGAGTDARVRRGGPLRPLARPHRPAGPQRRQHRHRRLRPGPGHGLCGAAALQRPLDDVPVRLQRRRGRHRRGDPRPGPGRDPVHRLLQDLHHHRDPDQRPHGQGLAAGRPRRPGGRLAALRGRVDQRREGGRLRHRPGQHVRVLGLGRGPLLRTRRRSGCR